MSGSNLRKALEAEAAQGQEASSIVLRLLDPSELAYVSGGSHTQIGSGSFSQNSGTAHGQNGSGNFNQSGGSYTQTGSGSYSKLSWDDYLEGDG